ncbi:MAG: alanine--tRNA ligase, partial [Opitutaceae bacterium]|nr:alanine--tRNA ligase [Cytophagales bacterium]
KEPQSKRIADTQKCLRVSGKHNDLEDVGHDTYHHTMFEMLGNWSFGDYFKKEAIHWAFELLTEVYKLPKDRMYASVFEGDVKEKLEFDQEAWDIWKELLPESQILKGNKKDNFWEMGDSGPCGPCSEIHFDLRPNDEINKVKGRDLVNNDHPQVIEIWNNVFIQYNRKADSSLEPLPAKHVDTGMGFERLVRVIQGKTSNYDTDVFMPMINFIEIHSGKKYGVDEKTDVAMRVLVDHIRAVAFAIGDGQLPSNNKAGYVIRRILRRAVRYGFTFLDLKEPFFHKLVPLLADQFKGVFNELYLQKDFVTRVVQEEEISFLRTLENGLKRLDQIIGSQNTKSIEGKVVFELYDTFGFPVDLTALIAKERGLSIDEKAFETEMNIQKDRSRQAASVETGDWVQLTEESSVFYGYDTLQTNAQIVKYRKVKEKNKELYQIVLDNNPFYAESGGQIGDTGYIEDAFEKIQVLDTKKENDLTYILSEKLPRQTDAVLNCMVDAAKRKLTTSHHTATHLLQAALRQVLGSHVQQKGSLVNTNLLRFDFAHFAKMTDEELKKVEEIVNQKIQQGIVKSEERNIPIGKAIEKGATALFGEKYGDSVRVITFDPNYSIELCGGTHVENTSQIGLIKIVSESSVAAGVRRIEAVTSSKAIEYFNEKTETLEKVNELLKSPKDILKTIQDLLDEKVKLSKLLEDFEHEKLNKIREELFDKIKDKDGLHFLAETIQVNNPESLKTLAFQIRNKYPDNLFCVLGSVINEKPQLAVILSDNLVNLKGLNATNIVRDLAKEIDGGGGGQPFFATAGGKKAEGLEKAVSMAEGIV